MAKYKWGEDDALADLPVPQINPGWDEQGAEVARQNRAGQVPDSIPVQPSQASPAKRNQRFGASDAEPEFEPFGEKDEPAGQVLTNPEQITSFARQVFQDKAIQLPDGRVAEPTHYDRMQAARGLAKLPQLEATDRMRASKFASDLMRASPATRDLWMTTAGFMAADAANKIAKGDHSASNYIKVAAYLEENEKLKQQYEEMSFAQKVSEGVLGSLEFMASTAAGAPIRALVKKSLKGVGKRAIGRAGSVLAQEAAAMSVAPGRLKDIASGAIDRAAPKGMDMAGIQEGDPFVAALGKSYGSNLISNLTERAGGLLPLKRIMAKAAGKKASEVASAAEWDGIIAEFLEERFEELGQGVFSGLTGDGFQFGPTADILSGSPERVAQGLEDYAVEAATIGVIGGPSKIANARRQQLRRQALGPASERWKTAASATEAILGKRQLPEQLTPAGDPAAEKDPELKMPEGPAIGSGVPGDPMAPNYEALAAGKQRELAQQTEEYFSNPLNHAAYAMQFPEEAAKLVSSGDFAAAGFPEVSDERKAEFIRNVQSVLDAPQGVTDAFLESVGEEGADFQITKTWSRVPDGVDVPVNDRVEVYENDAMGNFVRLKTAEVAEPEAQPKAQPEAQPEAQPRIPTELQALAGEAETETETGQTRLPSELQQSGDIDAPDVTTGGEYQSQFLKYDDLLNDAEELYAIGMVDEAEKADDQAHKLLDDLQAQITDEVRESVPEHQKSIAPSIAESIIWDVAAGGNVAELANAFMEQQQELAQPAAAATAPQAAPIEREVEDLPDEGWENSPQAIPQYVISGFQRSPTRIGEQKLSGRPLGIAVGPQRVSDNVMDKLAANVNRGGTAFIDSGMYGTVSKGEIGAEPDWSKVFEDYQRMIDRVDEDKRHNLMFVAPDYLVKISADDPRNTTGKETVIGDSEKTLELQYQYSGQSMEILRSGAKLLIPLQKDFTPPANEQDAENRRMLQEIRKEIASQGRVVDDRLLERERQLDSLLDVDGPMLLGEIASLASDNLDLSGGNFGWAIPYNLAAWADEDILAYVRQMKKGTDGSGMHLHLLGGGKPRAEKLWEKIAEIDPTVKLTGDASTETRNQAAVDQPGVTPTEVTNREKLVNAMQNAANNLRSEIQDLVDDGWDAVDAFTHIESLAEEGVEGWDGFKTPVRDVLIEAGYYRPMSEKEIANTTSTRGTVWDFKRKGQAYKSDEGLETWIDKAEKQKDDQAEDQQPESQTEVISQGRKPVVKIDGEEHALRPGMVVTVSKKGGLLTGTIRSISKAGMVTIANPSNPAASSMSFPADVVSVLGEVEYPVNLQQIMEKYWGQEKEEIKDDVFGLLEKVDKSEITAWIRRAGIGVRKNFKPETIAEAIADRVKQLEEVPPAAASLLDYIEANAEGLSKNIFESQEARDAHEAGYDQILKYMPNLSPMIKAAILTFPHTARTELRDILRSQFPESIIDRFIAPPKTTRRITDPEQEALNAEADKALEAILGETTGAAEQRKVGKTAKSKRGQYVLPGMPGMAKELDRQDFVRKHRTGVLNSIGEQEQETIDRISKPLSEIFNSIFTREAKNKTEVFETDAWQQFENATAEEIAEVKKRVPQNKKKLARLQNQKEIIEDTAEEWIDKAFNELPKKSVVQKRKSESTLEAAEEKIKIANDALAKLMDKHRGKLTSGVDPELMADTIKVALLYVDAGVTTFQGYVERVSESFGEKFARESAPYIEAGWGALHRKGIVEDPAGTVDEYLPDVKTPDAPAAGEYGTLEKPDRVALGKHFQSQFESGKKYSGIVEARKEAAVLITGDQGSTIQAGTPAAKALDEAVEQGVVRAAREFAKSGAPLEVYDRMIELYDQQPRLAVKTGTSMRNQAYSTPVPLAWFANIVADVNRDMNAYDSSAGNGVMLLGVDTENAFANEIDANRAEALRELGYEVHQGDATEYTPYQSFDRVIINPPFGKHPDGDTWSVGGVKTEELDHAITLKSLEAMKSNGKAVIVIGSKGFERRQPKGELERGEAYRKQKTFYDAVYDNYNVTDHITIHGDMYAKQGAQFPIDVIIVNGKGKSDLPKPYQINFQNAIPRVIDSWEELRNVADTHVFTGTSRPSDLSTEPIEGELGGLQDILEGEAAPTRPGRTRPRRTGQRRGDRLPRTRPSDQPTGELRGEPDVPGAPGAEVQAEPEGLPPRATGSGQQRGGDVTGDVGSGTADVLTATGTRPSPPMPVERDAETEFQVTYEPRSGERGVGTLVPKSQARAVAQALEDAENTYGKLDEFVADELGYERGTLGKYFSAEQIDALALNFARHKEGKAFVLGDQTGVGKGRVAAGLMVYAKRQGMVPVFMTQSPVLYADMYRDLIAIGQHSEAKRFNALFTNQDITGKKKIEIEDGSFLEQTKPYTLEAMSGVADSVAAGKGMVATVTESVAFDKKGKQLGKTATGRQRTRKVTTTREFDAIFTTYNQMIVQGNTLRARHNFIERIAPNAFFILDESHNAGGQASQQAPQGQQEEIIKGAELIRRFLGEAQGASFLSATYAKRSSVMDLYAKTGMADAVEGGAENLIKTLIEGGVPLQQVLSEMLVESGTYLRRERSYDGIAFEAKVEETGAEEAEEVAGLFNAINDLDRIKEAIIKTDSFRRWLTSEGLGLGKDSATGTRGMESVEFSSILHNLVDQMLLSIKADSTADAAIASLERGEAPVIGLSNTMESALNNYLDNNPGIEAGDEIDFGFNSLAERYLERSREIRLVETLPNGQQISQRVRLPDSVLGTAGVEAYRRAKKMVDEFAADIPASPIDHIRQRIVDAGYSVVEITGRQNIVSYADGQMRYEKRSPEELGDAGKRRTVTRFNNGEIDVLILNQSGSTGLSAHASRDNPPAGQKRRHMIIAQADRNIDTFMQMLGRIHRTGQIAQHSGQPKGSNLPHYTLLMTEVPSELRPASVLMKKLSSLNANVTASAKGSISFEAPDILNKVGDRIVAEYMAEHPNINNALQPNGIVTVDPEGNPQVWPDIARKVTGRMAMRPILEQAAFWDSITESFNEEIEQLNKLGKNPLEATMVDLSAETIENVVIFEGDPNADSPFLQPAYATRARVKKQGQPYSIAQIEKKMEDVYGNPGLPSQEDAYAWAGENIKVAEEAIDAATEKAVERLLAPEAIQRTRDRAERNKMVFTRRLNGYAPGTAVMVDEVSDDETQGTEGSVLGIVLDVKPGKRPQSLSGWTATIALSSPDRVVRLPLSRIDTFGNASPGDLWVTGSGQVFGDKQKRMWEQPGEAYEERIIGTGNILAAFDRLVGGSSAKGNVVFFTDSEGVSRRGVLMPRYFNLDKWQRSRPVQFTSAEEVLTFLNATIGNQANDPNFAIQFTMMESGVMLVRSPRSRQRSGKYTTNDKLLQASGTDFVSVGSALQMKLTNPAKQKAVIEAALELGSLIAANNRGDAMSATGQVEPERASVPPEASVQPAVRRIGLQDASAAAGAAPARLSATSTGGAKTQGGQQLLAKLQQDIDAHEKGTREARVGRRSIGEFLAASFDAAIYVTRSQTTRRNPANFSSVDAGAFAARIFTRSPSWDLNIHEAGHAMDAWIRDTDPDWYGKHEKMLANFAASKIAVNASADNAKEGVAEIVRLYVTDPKQIPSNVLGAFESMIKGSRPEVMNILDDARIAYSKHESRDATQQAIADRNDRPPKTSRLTEAADLSWFMASHLIGGGVLEHRMKRQLYSRIAGDNALSMADPTGIYGTLKNVANKHASARADVAEALINSLEDSPADIGMAHQNRLRRNADKIQAMEGTRFRSGWAVEIFGDGFNELLDEEIDLLKQAGFKLPSKFQMHGGRQYLSSKSYAEIKKQIPSSEWEEFQQFALDRAALARYKKSKHPYPGMSLPQRKPQELFTRVEQKFKDNPVWNKTFKEIQDFMDQGLLISVLGGRHTAVEAIRMKEEYEYYLPLLRHMEMGKGPSSYSADAAQFGIYGAKGSHREYLGLDQAVYQRISQSIDAYYDNSVVRSAVEMTKQISKDRSIEYSVRKDFERLMIPLRLDTKLAAVVSAQEQAKIVAAATNRVTLAENSGVGDTSGMSDAAVAAALKALNLDPMQPGDVTVALPGQPVFRKTKPGMPMLKGAWEQGELTYYYVTDPLLYRFMSESPEPSVAVKRVTGFFGGMVNAWKRTYTQSLAFLIRNMPRDTVTASWMSNELRGKIPGFYLATGILGRITGSKHSMEAQEAAEFMARFLDATANKSQQTTWEAFKAMWTEGLVPSKPGSMTVGDWLTEAPGIAMSVLLKPIDVLNFVTGSRYLAEVSESLTREGAFIRERQLGKSRAKAHQQFDRISGNFGHRQHNKTFASMIRVAGFLNPFLQIMWQTVEAATHHSPRTRLRNNATSAAMLTSIGAALAAANVLLIYAGDDEEEREERFRKMRERPEPEKLANAAIYIPFFGGTLRVPFDTGPAGAILSLAYNTVEDWLIGTPVDAKERASEILRRGAPLPQPSQFVPPHALTAFELGVNYSYYRHRDIVPEHMQRNYAGNEHLQYYPSTPELYKDMASSLNSIHPSLDMSPIKIQYAVRGLTTAIVDDTVKFMDKVGKDTATIKDFPMISGLSTWDADGVNSRSVRALADIEEEYQRLNTLLDRDLQMTDEQKQEAEQKRETLQLAHATMWKIEKLRDEQRLLSAEGTNGENQQAIKDINREITMLASDFIRNDKLDLTVIDNYYNTQNEKLVPYHRGSWRLGKTMPEMPGRPQKPRSVDPRGWERYEKSLATYDDRVEAFAKRQENAKEFTSAYLRWLAKHRQNPEVQKRIQEIASNRDLRDALFSRPPKSSESNYRKKLQAWRDARNAALQLKELRQEILGK